MTEIIVTTGTEIPGKKLKILGIVKGNTVRSRHIGRDIMASFKMLVGGEIKTFTDLISLSRDEAYKRMVEEAEKMKADGIIAMRFGTSSIMASSSELLAYGTAVKFV
jgi:uncharacterized protein YbjQ (UPF0145 family)